MPASEGRGYTVKEIFYTLQGEGANAGRPAVFCRFAGCNLWNGLEDGRDTGKGGCAKWCDTDFVGGARYDSAGDLALACQMLWPTNTLAAPFVVLTGGEPLLQVDADLTAALRRHKFEIAVETNGTQAIPTGVDWVTLSPKQGALVVCGRVDEVKFVYPQDVLGPESFSFYGAKHHFIQPRDGHPGSTQAAIDYVLSHPEWRLSLQTHKLVGLR